MSKVPFKRRFKKKKPNSSLKREVKALKVKVAKNDPELKSFDTAWSSSFDSTGSVNSLTLVPQALTKYGRVGNKIRLQGLMLRMYLSTNVSGALNQTCRIIVFRDKSPPSASGPGITDVLETSATWEIMAKENKDRFVFYYDKMHRLTYNTYTDNSTRLVDSYINLHGQIQNYESSTTNTAFGSNLYMLLLGDSASFGVNFDGRTRLLFKDA